MKWQGFGKRLYHDAPSWVDPGNFFHICIRVAREQQTSLIAPRLADALLKSAQFYHDKNRWWLGIFLLMPDHLHVLVAFPRQEDMSAVIGDWKRWQATKHNIFWQREYFGHRIREDESGVQIQNQADYVLDNPVRAELCKQREDWPWKLRTSNPMTAT